MKKSLFVFFLCLMSFASTNAQTSTSNTKTTVASPDSNVNFRLYQTNNRWTFFLEHSPFIVLQELPEVLFGPESLFEALVQVACVRTRVLCQIILSPCFRGEIAVERVRFGIGP